MGEMAEYYSSRDVMDHDVIQSTELKRKKLNQYYKWRQGDGSTILITKMSISHLENSIKKIKRDNWRTEWLPYLEVELESRTHK